MALATLCPHCRTTFRVANDQLKLRSGLVRCGSCNQIFNGIEHLLQPDQVPPPQALPAAAKAVAPMPPSLQAITNSTNPVSTLIVTETPTTNPAVQISPAPSAHVGAPVRPAPEVIPPAPSHTPPHIENSDRHPLPPPLVSNSQQHDSPIDFSQLEDAIGSEADVDANAPGIHQSINYSLHVEENESTDLSLAEAEPDTADDEPYQPLTSFAESDQVELENVDQPSSEQEPDFVIRGRRRQKIARITRILMWCASLLLLLGLAAQATFVFRNQLAAWFPQAKPVLLAMCETFTCKVHLLSQIDSVAIESSELQALAVDKNTFTLMLLLRNYSATTQAWPNIELTLNDSNEKAVVRRVFTPRDYLPGQDTTKGFPPNSEQSIKLPFALLQLKASGYRVYLFYP